ncbi:MAG: hypothetical protein IK125_03265 [Lachnospiraceae bacterium]|nr:hypothetical protein [Lachnospiraceae bacterium]
MPRSVLEMFDIPETLELSFVDSLSDDDLFGIKGIWQLSYRDLRTKKITINNAGELAQFTFNDATVFPPELPDMAEKVMEDGKAGRISNHTGLTGKGVKIAIIDKPLNPMHKEFGAGLEVIKVEPENENHDSVDFHGMTCASLLAGKTCGAAPEAVIKYFQIPDSGDRAEISKYALKALKMIVAYNMENATDPIRLVSWSGGFTKEDMQERNDCSQILSQMGCYLIDATMFMRNFGGIDFDPYAECDEKKYSLNRWQLDNYERNKERPGFSEWFDNCCYVPSSRCTSASDDIVDGYIHWGKAVSESWTIPQTVGAMALCLQKWPDLTYESFVALAKQCPRVNGFIILNMDYIIETSDFVPFLH